MLLRPMLLVLLAFAAPAAAADPLRGAQWNLDAVRGSEAHPTQRGAGAVIAVIDSGVRFDHPDLAGRLLPGKDVYERDGVPQDEDGHGTHVSGTAVAGLGNGHGIVGVAPDAKVLPVRVLGPTRPDGSSTTTRPDGTNASVGEAVDYAVEQGAHVINLSLGDSVPLLSTIFGPADGDAIERAIRRGIVVVLAAGNSGLPFCEQAEYEGRVLCVAATDRSGQIASYSSSAGRDGITAPGGGGGRNGVLAPFLRRGSDDYEFLSGTSMAAPHVSGVAALLIGAGLSGPQAIDRILATARDLGSPGPDTTYGAGMVDAAAAVAGLRATVPSAGTGAAGTGAGAAGGGPGAGPALARASVAVDRRQRASVVRRRGLRLRVRSPHAGTVRVRVLRGRRTVARGTARVRAGVRRVLRARLTATGRRLVRPGRAVRLTVRVTLPDGRTLTRRTAVRR